MAGVGWSQNAKQEAESHLTSTDLVAQSRPSRPVDHHTRAERDSSADDRYLWSESGGCESTAVQTGHQSADFNTGDLSSPRTDPELQPPCSSRLSLFSGMQLVTKRHSDLDDERSPAHQSPSIEAPSISSSAPAESSQPPSAFSFLNL